MKSADKESIVVVAATPFPSSDVPVHYFLSPPSPLLLLRADRPSAVEHRRTALLVFALWTARASASVRLRSRGAIVGPPLRCRGCSNYGLAIS